MTTVTHLESPRSAAQVQTLVRAFSILEAVARNPAGIGLAEVSRAAGLHKSTGFRMLRTLAMLGYVVQSADSKLYRMSDRLRAPNHGDLQVSS
jgi:DNA-binding IclR family transcriptional regulator